MFAADTDLQARAGLTFSGVLLYLVLNSPAAQDNSCYFSAPSPHRRDARIA